jgi:cytochrome c oxidase subunit I
VLSTAGATILGAGYLLPMIYLAWSWKYGKPAGSNPWGARGLEWETTSPPPTFNFDRTPVVTEATHAYGHSEEAHVA